MKTLDEVGNCLSSSGTVGTAEGRRARHCGRRGREAAFFVRRESLMFPNQVYDMISVI